MIRKYIIELTLKNKKDEDKVIELLETLTGELLPNNERKLITVEGTLTEIFDNVGLADNVTITGLR